MNETPFVTTATDLAVYLVLSGFNLIEIQYDEPLLNGKRRGIFIFSTRHPDKPDSYIEDFKNKFANHQAPVDPTDFKETKVKLMDRLMKELP